MARCHTSTLNRFTLLLYGLYCLYFRKGINEFIAYINATRNKLPRRMYWMLQPVQHFNSSEG